MKAILPFRCAESVTLSIIDDIVMQLNVSQLLREPIGSVREHKISGMVDITDNGGGAPVEGEVQLTRTNRSILVRGRLQVAIELTCARCLNLFIQPLALDIEEEFFPVADPTSGVPLALPDDEPDGFTIDDNQVIDLTDVVRQYAVMAIPMKPLCRQDCAGL